VVPEKLEEESGREEGGREGKFRELSVDSLARAVLLGEASKRKRAKGGVRMKMELKKQAGFEDG